MTPGRGPCPLHSDCEAYLDAEACEYRSGRMTEAEAEDRAGAFEDRSYGGDGTFADNH